MILPLLMVYNGDTKFKSNNQYTLKGKTHLLDLHTLFSIINLLFYDGVFQFILSQPSL